MDYINDPDWDDALRDDCRPEEYHWDDQANSDARPAGFIDRPARQKPPAPPPQNSPGCLASLFGFALFDRLMFPADEEGFDDFLDDLFF